MIVGTFLTPRSVPTKCAYCHSAIESTDVQVKCLECKAIHHRQCAESNGNRCPACNRTEADILREGFMRERMQYEVRLKAASDRIVELEGEKNDLRRHQEAERQRARDDAAQTARYVYRLTFAVILAVLVPVVTATGRMMLDIIHGPEQQLPERQ